MPNAKEESNIEEALIENFMAITGTNRTVALYFLEACRGNLSSAIGMHMDTPNAATPGSSGASCSTNGTGKRKRGHAAANGSTPAQPEEEQIRAPIPQRTEVLAPNGVAYRRPGKRRKPHSVFDQFRDFQAESTIPNDALDRGPGGSSRRTLQELFRPPVELLHRGTFDSARQAATGANRWLIATIHNATEFQCQVLNRDVWSNGAIQELIRQRFILWQVYSDSLDGVWYKSHYGINDWPYVAIIDPRTGEKMICWQKIDANTFLEIASEFLSLHPAPSESELDLRPTKKARTEPSIVDASEESQLTAAFAASIRENSYHPGDSTAGASTSDDETNNRLYDSDSDLETFSDSDNSRPASHASRSDRRTPQTVSYEETVVTVSQAGGAITGTETTAPTSNGHGSTEADEPWRQYLGDPSDPAISIVFRGPNDLREQLTIPNSSTLMTLVSFATTLGYSPDRYELLAHFPRRSISRLDLSSTLRDLGFTAREIVFIQEFTI